MGNIRIGFEYYRLISKREIIVNILYFESRPSPPHINASTLVVEKKLVRSNSTDITYRFLIKSLLYHPALFTYLPKENFKLKLSKWWHKRVESTYVWEVCENSSGYWTSSLIVVGKCTHGTKTTSSRYWTCILEVKQCRVKS